ncbi:MAG: hypothetical protein JWP42_1415 [Pseudomonas sp.]|nr:hypothetical protein [Pseudomonas sp.]
MRGVSGITADDTPLSRASSLPQKSLLNGEVRRSLVGASLLARGVNDDARCLYQRGVLESIASKLAPAVDWGEYRFSVHCKSPCGSELARECGGSVGITANDTPLSRASSLPQKSSLHAACLSLSPASWLLQLIGVKTDFPFTANPLVGASLLANAVGQSTLIVTDTPLSRASPLPQVRLHGSHGRPGCFDRQRYRFGKTLVALANCPT